MSDLIVTNSLRFKLICFFVSLIPAWRILHLIDCSCSDVIDIDFLDAMSFLNCGLASQIDPVQLLKNSSFSGHPQLTPLLMHLINAKLFSLNARLECILSVLLTYISVFLAFDCLNSKGKASYVLLPILAFLQFSLCLSSQFFYSYLFVSASLSQFFLTLGIWAIARLKNRLFASILMFVSGVICSSCAGSYVVACWSVFGLLLVALKRFEKPFLCSFPIGLCVSAIPMAMVYASGKIRVDPGSTPFESAARLISSLSLAFFNNTAGSLSVGWQTVAMGLISIVFLVVLSLYFAIKDKRNTPDFVYCAWGFIIFGIINLCATSAARIYISPWYCAYSVFVWTGICALAVGVLCQATKKPPSIPARGFASIVLLYCLVFYVITNRNYADKDFFRPFHSPSAESCLRNYRWAPTYAFYQLFGSKFRNMVALLRFGNQVALNRLSCFSANQTWTLQGDFILPTVQFINGNPNSAIRWINGAKLKSLPLYGDPEQLTLAMPSGSKAIWTLNFPETLRDSRLLFDLACDKNTHSKNFSVSVLDNNGAPLCPTQTFTAQSGGRNYSIPIDHKNARTITLLFESAKSETDDAGQILLKYPRLDCRFDFAKRLSDPVPALMPSNVDDAPEKYGTVVSSQYLDNSVDSWNLCDINLIGQSGLASLRGISSQSRLAYKKNANIDPNYWTEFFFDFAENEEVRPRLVMCQFTLSSGQLKSAIIPILTDSKMHRYYFELKLLQLNPGEKILFLQILPVFEPAVAEYSCGFGKLGFVRRLNKIQKTLCADGAN